MVMAMLIAGLALLLLAWLVKWWEHAADRREARDFQRQWFDRQPYD